MAAVQFDRSIPEAGAWRGCAIGNCWDYRSGILLLPNQCREPHCHPVKADAHEPQRMDGLQGQHLPIVNCLTSWSIPTCFLKLATSLRIDIRVKMLTFGEACESDECKSQHKDVYI